MAFAVLRPRRMVFENAVVAICSGVGECEAAVLELFKDGIAAEAISAVTVDEGRSAASAYYFEQGGLRRAPDQPGCRRVWEALSGCVVLTFPGERNAVVAGPLAASIVRALDQGELLGKLGPLAAGLYNLGIPRDAAREYELAAWQGRSLVMASGRSRDLARIGHILEAGSDAPEGTPRNGAKRASDAECAAAEAPPDRAATAQPFGLCDLCKGKRMEGRLLHQGPYT